MGSGDNSDLIFEYQPKWLYIMGLVVLSVILGLCVWIGFFPDQFPFKFGIKTPVHSTGRLVLAWSMVFVSVIGIAYAIYAGWSKLRKETAIFINSNRIMVPESLFSDNLLTIPFSEVSDIEELSLPVRSGLKLKHKNGTVQILKPLCGSEADYESLKLLIEKFTLCNQQPVAA